MSLSKRPSPATAISLVALFVALGGTSYAAITVSSKNVRNGSLTGTDVKNSSLTGRDIKNRSIAAVDLRGPLPAGPAGAQGPAGAPGAKGDKGDTGATGAPGISGYERIQSQVPASSNSAKTLTVTCSAGKKILGGGARVVSGEGQVIMDEAYPTSDTTFFGETRTVGGGSVNHGLIVVAICGTVAD